MLKKEHVREICGDDKIYEKGEKITKEGGVRGLQSVQASRGNHRFVRTKAKVRVREGELYQVEGEICEDFSEMDGMFCTCPKFLIQDGICEHCVAVLLEYIQNRDTRVQNAKTAAGQGITPARSTSGGLSRIISRYGEREKRSFRQSAIEGKVQLQPVVSVLYGQARVEFRVGIQRMYVLKDTMVFADAIERGELVSYGKELEFYHTPGAFAPDCLGLVEFLCQEAENRRQTYEGWGTAYFDKSGNRYLKLHNGNMDDFFQAVESMEFVVDMENTGKQKWRVMEQEYPLVLDIHGTEDGAVLMAQSFTYTFGKKYIYLWAEGGIYRLPIAGLRDLRPLWNYFRDYKYTECFISKADLPLFCREMLPILKKYYTVQRQQFHEENYLPPKAAYECYLDAPDRHTITCRVFACYDDKKYNIYEKPKMIEQRDELAEMKLARQVGGWFQTVDPQRRQLQISGDEEKIYALLTEGILDLRQFGTVYVSDAVKSIRVLPTPAVSAGISLKGNLLELELDSGEMPLEEMLEILERYDRKKRYYRLKNGDFVSMEAGGLAVVSELGGHLCIPGGQWRSGPVTLPKYRALYLDEAWKDQNGFHAVKSRDFKALIRNMKTIEDNDFEVPESLEKVLRQYQRQGFLWLKTLKNNGFSGILADDMGLGKTLQVIAFLLSEQQDGQQEEGDAEERNFALIVCPASLVYNWKKEIERFAPQLSAVTITGTAPEREQLLAGASNGDILITSYDLLRRDLDWYLDVSFQFQIIDEAQYIKNHTTKLAKSVKAVKADFKAALTGTPIENRLSELWSIFDFLMPGFLYQYGRFREELEIPIVAEQDQDTAECLKKLIRPFVLRRLKKDVLQELPDKIEEAVYAGMEGPQRELYAAHVQKIRYRLEHQPEQEFSSNKIQILAELTRLRQLCCDPGLLYENYQGESGKMVMCMDLLRNAVDAGHKVLLFSQFTTMLYRIQQQMEREEIPYLSLTGMTKKERRMQLVEEFQNGAVPVFCISLKAGGTGLNLTAADIVIHYDPWWNVAVQNQATDRAHRIGQKNVLTVYKLIAKGTIEENILNLQEKKKELAEQMLGQGGFEAVKFTREELLELLRD